MHLSLFQILFFTSEATNVLHESSHCFHAPVFFNCTSDFVFMLLWCFSLALTLRSLWNLLPGVFHAIFLQLTLLPLFPFLHPSQFEHCILWKIQCDNFFLAWVSFLTIAPCHTVMTASPVLFFFLPMLLLYSLLLISSLFVCHSLQCFFFFTPFSASVQIAVSNSFSPQNEHHFRSPSRGCFCSTILARSSPPLQLRLVQSAPLCESHLQRWEERILYTVSKVWSYCEIKVTGQLQIKYS